MMTPRKKAQSRYGRQYQKQHRDKAKHAVYKSQTKSFILKYANKKDLTKIDRLLKQKHA